MIKLFTGPMFSSKSTQLYYEMEKSIFAKQKIAFIRPLKDSREYVAHSIIDKGFKKFIDNKEIDLFTINEFTNDLCKELNVYNRVYIDEFFMIKNNKLLCNNINANQEIYFAGLISTSENMLFDEAKDILPLCDKIEKFNGICSICNSFLGSYTMYRGSKTESIVIGDNDKYLCVCRNCYIKEKGKL